MKLDAHCHTDCSDGAISIEERISMIRGLGFDAATITDHDFISEEQVEKAQAAAGHMPFIPGIELTLAHHGKVVHILGFYVDPGDFSIQQHITRVQNLDQAYTTMLLEIFRPQGITFGLEDLIAPSLHTCYSLHFIKRLSRDLFSNHKEHTLFAFFEALDRLEIRFSDFAPWPVYDAIRMIHNAGGYSVLAHPGGAEDTVMRKLGFLQHTESHIRQYFEWGLDGIEVFSPVHSTEETRYYSELAKKYNLLITAGSDCHGDDPLFGPSRMGTFSDIPENLYENMFSCHRLHNYYTKKIPAFQD